MSNSQLPSSITDDISLSFWFWECFLKTSQLKLGPSIDIGINFSTSNTDNNSKGPCADYLNVVLGFNHFSLPDDEHE